MPEWQQALRQQLAGLQLAPTREAEIIEELAQHLDDRYEELRVGGATDEEAYRAALAELSDNELLAQELRRVEQAAVQEPLVLGAAGRRNLLADLWQDVRYGWRMLRRQPAFTLVAVLTLALSIGANTAVFSLTDAFLLRLLPVKDPQQLVFVRATRPRGGTTGSFPAAIYEQLRALNQSCVGLFAYDDAPVSVTIDGRPEMVSGDFVSGSYFDVLGVSALLGRTFTAADDQPGREATAVISYNYWERRFARDPKVIGQTIYVGKLPFSVIGVTPPGFFGRNVAGHSADLVLPMFMQRQLALRDHDTMQIMARLKPGISTEQARADLDVIYQQALLAAAGAQLSPQVAQALRAQRIELQPGLRGTASANDSFATELRILLAVVGIVLLIACVNVAHLLLARATARRKEIAVRLSLGANRGRLVRQMLTESILLALLGGVLGLLFAAWGVGSLLAALSYDTPLTFTLKPDAKVLVFTSAVSLLTGIVFGLAPALAATRVELNTLLKGNEGGTETRPRRRRLAKSLVVLQVALSLTLLIGAGLLLGSLRQLYEVDTGFERERVLTMWIFPALLRYDHAREMRLYQELLTKINALPGVQAVSLSRYSLTLGKGGNVVGPRFFETLGIRLLRGRDFNANDTEAAPRVAIISESMARSIFPNENPVGQLLPDEFNTAGTDTEIIGVVSDIRNRLRQQTWGADVYVPYMQVPPGALGQVKLFVRTVGAPASIVPVLRREVAAVEPDLVLHNIQTQGEELQGFVGGERALATLLSFFGALALMLAAIGLYGTMAYAVGRRTKEFGIRMTLGAQRHAILWLVLRETLALVALGIVVGIPVALLTTRLIARLLFGVRPTDPVTITLAVLTMLTVALVAGYLPAHRATKVDPMVALRYE
ncbi:MAG: ADOP family duplicated permease [Pyrinomonadaceae bacterium]